MPGRLTGSKVQKQVQPSSGRGLQENPPRRSSLGQTVYPAKVPSQAPHLLQPLPQNPFLYSPSPPGLHPGPLTPWGTPWTHHTSQGTIWATHTSWVGKPRSKWKGAKQISASTMTGGAPMEGFTLCSECGLTAYLPAQDPGGT